ncbi:MAG: ATP-binding protein [Flavobacteriales bacterium]|jgi:energy-coupling factor transporter ATP-binding protein EcfA2|nr:ATP-binding protein [Flavobacteriales bacterium]
MLVEFNPYKVISQKDLSEIVGNSPIKLGKIVKLSNEKFNWVLQSWVKQIEVFLSKSEKIPELYYELLQQRFITFEEYTQLFSSIDVEDYAYFPPYRCFNIKDKTELSIFTSNKQPTFESFLQTFSKEIKNNNLNGLDILLSDIDATLKKENLNRHSYIVGKTGSGKSELLKLLFTNITRKSEDCLILVDPHGDLAKQFAQVVQDEQPQRLLYFDPFLHSKEEKYPIINPLFSEGKSEQEIDLLAQNLTAVFEELLPNELSTNMKAVLEPCISVLLKQGNCSLSDLQQLIKGDKKLLSEAKKNAKHHRLFFENFNDGLYTQTKSAIFTKIQSLLNSRVFYNCVTGTNTINLSQAIKEKKIIIFNLNKGLFGEEHAQAFGKLLISQIKNFALKQNEKERKQIYLAVDECHNFISKSMETILTEARKYRLSLILSNQMSKQLGGIEETTLSNVGAFFVGNSNSKETLQKISSISDIPMMDLKATPNYHFWFNSNNQSFQFKVSDELLDVPNNFETIKTASLSYYGKHEEENNDAQKKEKPKFGL